MFLCQITWCWLSSQFRFHFVCFLVVTIPLQSYFFAQVVPLRQGTQDPHIWWLLWVLTNTALLSDTVQGGNVVLKLLNQLIINTCNRESFPGLKNAFLTTDCRKPNLNDESKVVFQPRKLQMFSMRLFEQIHQSMRVTTLETHPPATSSKNFNTKSRKRNQQNQNHLFAIRAEPSTGIWVWSFQGFSWHTERYLHRRQTYTCHTYAVSKLREIDWQYIGDLTSFQLLQALHLEHKLRC